MAKRTARKTTRAATPRAASRTTKRRAGTGKTGTRRAAPTSTGRKVRKPAGGPKTQTPGARKAARKPVRKTTVAKPSRAASQKTAISRRTKALPARARATSPRPEPGPSPAPPPVTAPPRSKRRPTPPLVAIVEGHVVGDDEPADEAEVEAPETPTSFNLDLRRARTGAAMLDDPVDVDPDSAVALTAGDRDVSPESAATIGDETPGGDNPTPDMDVVDLIGRSLGVEYEDNEELKGADKIVERDKKRWELDPASAEDYKERSKS